MGKPIIEANKLGKRYRLGVYGMSTLREELGSFLQRRRDRIQGSLEGDTEMSCRMDTCLLNPGRYRLGFQIFEGSDLIQYVENLAIFEVSPGFYASIDWLLTNGTVTFSCSTPCTPAN